MTQSIEYVNTNLLNKINTNIDSQNSRGCLTQKAISLYVQRISNHNYINLP